MLAMVSVYLPTLHAVQCFACTTCENLPCGHSSQVPSRANKGPSNLPGRHSGVGAGVGAGVGEGVGLGVGLGTHALAPSCPLVQSVIGQGWQVSAWGFGENWPLTQAEHSRSVMGVSAAD